MKKVIWYQALLKYKIFLFSKKKCDVFEVFFQNFKWFDMLWYDVLFNLLSQLNHFIMSWTIITEL